MQLGNTNVKSQFAARDAISVIDTAINTVSQARANVGAVVSRFEFRSQQIATTIENVQAANSAISDVDVAAEQSKLVSSQVLVQASVSALSQARSEEHTSELQSLMRISYAVFCFKKKKYKK